jgi:hypothetical protein
VSQQEVTYFREPKGQGGREAYVWKCRLGPGVRFEEEGVLIMQQSVQAVLEIFPGMQITELAVEIRPKIGAHGGDGDVGMR